MESIPPPRGGPPPPTDDIVQRLEGIGAGPLLKLLGGHVERCLRLLQTFAQHHASDVAALHAAAAGGDVPAQRLHALKGASAAIGAEALHRRAADIDERLRRGTAPAALTGELSQLADELQGLLDRIAGLQPD